MASAHKKFLSEIIEANQATTAKIEELVSNINNESEDNASDAIKAILVELHATMIRISEHRGHPRTPNKLILDAYRSFFDAIRALSELPSGDFLNARMVIYLMQAILGEHGLSKGFVKSKARVTTVPLYEMCADVDEALLEPLRRIWAASNQSEDFRWAFGSYTVRHQSCNQSSDAEQELARSRELVQALTPEELEALGGIKKQSYMVSKRTKKLKWIPVPDDKQDLDSAMTDLNKVMFKFVENEGPMRNLLSFHTIDEEQNDEKSHRAMDVFRRSRQFIMDARSIIAPIQANKSHRLAKQALTVAGFPPELLMSVFGYLEKPKAHPYLGSVDIAGAYVPFPETTGLCSECKTRNTGAANRRLKFTCPGASIYAWNLALRTFHVFHQKTATAWRLCKYGLDCEGHHENSYWEIQTETELVDLAEATIRGKCGSLKTLKQAGLGQDPGIKLTHHKDDEERRERVYPEQPWLVDQKGDAEMSGGIGGLVDTMIHKRLLLGSWTSGSSSTESHWSFARNMVDKQRAEEAIGSVLHTRCDLC
ncbi:hypothetical protein B0J13DRAFT_646052 [Dactylonectria estremocensis]|uniref:Uncharacterized protein n=1 Tax=Dactylonectria estremocensis TaxID=1079267 RepID=A0A9P9DYV4_9HYPO|nr:hypothetical protein B0J13DRAFT_646052 [Dactylonectria estremocensis]